MIAASHGTKHVVSSVVLCHKSRCRWLWVSNVTTYSVQMLATRLAMIRLARTRGANRCNPEKVASSSFCGHLQRPAVVLHRYAPLWTRRNRRVHISEADVGYTQANGEEWFAETEETTNIGGLRDAEKVQKPRMSLRLSVASIRRY
jgi:hypothetical protein